MLKLDDVHTYYGPVACLKGISLEVNEGEAVALIGANGAGKSTVLMTISGILRPKTGAVTFLNKRIDTLSPDKIVALGISQVPEGRRVFPYLSVKENLDMGSYLRSDRAAIDDDLARAFKLFPILKERRSQLAGTLSGGEQQMLALARALMARPKLLLLDEPSLGLAPILVEEIFSTIARINKEGTTILLVEQNARLALTLASRGYVLETGRITLHDKSESLLNNPYIRKAYLGE